MKKQIAKVGIVKFSELGTRLDATFHLARQTVASEEAQLKERYTEEEALQILGQFRDADKAPIAPLIRGQRTSPGRTEYARAEREYPHLALALILNSGDDIRKAIDERITAANRGLNAIDELEGAS